MPRWLRWAPLLFLAFCAACSSKCVIPDASSCAVDSDCVIAVCADNACNCGCGAAIEKSQLGESACLVESGTAPPVGCRPNGPECMCASRICGAACVSGICTITIPDGG